MGFAKQVGRPGWADVAKIMLLYLVLIGSNPKSHLSWPSLVTEKTLFFKVTKRVEKGPKIAPTTTQPKQKISSPNFLGGSSRPKRVRKKIGTPI